MECWLWGVVPAVAAIAAIVLSLAAWRRRPRGRGQLALTALVVGVNVWALWALARVFLFGAWPTFLPHILIAISIAASLLVRRVAKSL